jgi:predicted RNA-binding Zn-ribbon protein involved in translation (DUF1610 family)
MSHSVDETYTLYEERFPRARKPHTCMACGERIAGGQRYARVFVLFQGDAETVKRCLRCQQIHEHLREMSPGDTWPAERLDCGEDYEDHWGGEPPDHIAALAFALPGETE